ncbi:hypothetical protein Hanom_Chr09g00801271 [Helianthus anomalus]
MAAAVTNEFNLVVVCSDPNLTRNNFNPGLLGTTPFHLNWQIFQTIGRVFPVILHRVNVGNQSRLDLRVLKHIRKKSVRPQRLIWTWLITL